MDYKKSKHNTNQNQSGTDSRNYRMMKKIPIYKRNATQMKKLHKP
jgi:hypothetical protein